MNRLDLHAVPDASPAEESAFDHYVTEIGGIDGRRLYEYEPDMIDGLLDTFRNILNVPLGHDLFNVPPANTPWSELDEYDRAMWSTLATAIRSIAVCYLDEGRARESAAA